MWESPDDAQPKPGPFSFLPPSGQAGGADGYLRDFEWPLSARLSPNASLWASAWLDGIPMREPSCAIKIAVNAAHQHIMYPRYEISPFYSFYQNNLLKRTRQHLILHQVPAPPKEDWLRFGLTLNWGTANFWTTRDEHETDNGTPFKQAFGSGS